MDPDKPRSDYSNEIDSDGPDRPLPPPPTLGELVDVFRQRLGLRYPSLDATRVVLVIAALVGVGGMAWVVWGPGHEPAPPHAIRVTVASSTSSSTTVGTTTTEPPTFFVVDVAGAVRRPGPVQVATGARVVDAIAAAGGAAGDADLERVDRAARLADGQRVYVPRRGQGEIPEVVGPGGTGSSDAVGGTPDVAPAPAGGTTTPAGPIDLNTADEAVLDTLPGVGPATAKAIVEYRRANGRFRSVDELMEVKGIGPAKMATIRPHVTV